MGTQWFLFMNQILLFANPHDKLSALCVSKSWVPKYLSINPLRSKTRISLSFHMQDGGFGMEDMDFNDLGLLLRVIDIQWFSISLFMVFKSLWCNVRSSPTL
jgi:hypothetical protein